MATDMTVANEILRQLGGGAALKLMTGAKKFMGDEKSLTVIIGGGAHKKITRVTVTLNKNDLYDVQFGKVFKYEYKTVASHEDVHVENLREIFTKETGFVLTVPRIVGINA